MLVNCVAYQGGKKLCDISTGDIHLFVNEPDCFVWVALNDPEPAELENMQKEFRLHELAIEDARHGHQRPKIEEYGPSLFAVVQMIEPEGNELKVGEVDIFVAGNYVLSVRRGAQRGFKEVRARCEREPELLSHGSGYVLYALMDAVVDRYFPVLDSLATELESIEERIFANQTTRLNIEALYGLRRKLTVLKHAIEPLIEVARRLYAGRVPLLVVGLQDYFRDVHDHLIRLNQAIDGLRDTTTTAISVNLALLTAQETEVTKKLAAGAALVATPTLIAGVYGMNFEHMPELEWAYGYPVAMALMMLIDGYLFYRFRKAKWL